MEVVLVVTVQEYRQNELYAAAWIDMIIEHTCRATGGSDLKAEVALSSLLNNNARLLDEVVTSDTVELFESLVLSQTKDARYLSLLTSLCSCLDKPILSNQTSVLHLLYQRSHEQLMIPLTLEGQEVYVRLPPDCPRKHSTEMLPRRMLLRDFLESADIRIFQLSCVVVQWAFLTMLTGGVVCRRYFVALLDLCAELCLGRHKAAIDRVSTDYPLPAIMRMLTLSSEFAVVVACCDASVESPSDSGFLLYGVECYETSKWLHGAGSFVSSGLFVVRKL